MGNLLYSSDKYTIEQIIENDNEFEFMIKFKLVKVTQSDEQCYYYVLPEKFDDILNDYYEEKKNNYWLDKLKSIEKIWSWELPEKDAKLKNTYFIAEYAFKYLKTISMSVKKGFLETDVHFYSRVWDEVNKHRDDFIAYIAREASRIEEYNVSKPSLFDNPINDTNICSILSKEFKMECNKIALAKRISVPRTNHDNGYKVNNNTSGYISTNKINIQYNLLALIVIYLWHNKFPKYMTW